MDTIELTTAHEFQVHGERGWFHVKRVVDHPGQAYYIDAYGGMPGKERWRSFRPDAVRNVRLIPDRGAADVRVIFGCLFAAGAFGCIFAELGSRWFILPAILFGLASMWAFNRPRRVHT